MGHTRFSSLLIPSTLLLLLHCGGTPDGDPAGAPESEARPDGDGGAAGFDPAGSAGGRADPDPQGGAGGQRGEEVPAPTVSLDDVALYINVGASVAAGYNAAGNNEPGGRGYARLLLSNHPDFPAYGAADLNTRSGAVDFRDVSDSGATSDEIRANLEAQLNGFPQSVAGDVLLTIAAGGNDFNDSIAVMLSASLSQGVAANLRHNLSTMVSLVRDRYEDPSQDKEVIVVFQTLHDPTGGTGSIPPGFDDGFCGTLQSPMLRPLAGIVLGNLAIVNDAVLQEAVVQGAHVSDNHEVFIDHGMNAPGDGRWLSGDCTHPTNEGHNQIRREIWGTLTGEWL